MEISKYPFDDAYKTRLTYISTKPKKAQKKIVVQNNLSLEEIRKIYDDNLLSNEWNINKSKW